ncbi:hypothetical protein A7U60_g4261 [Sanghuangporus baumii]|uniref:DNA endonuclease activator Ctp1 C-terminal domain-containing protein n=1 Tax=Sanghuangporus baumii TaxID=108892 RepID=A0A9Q5HYV7_SANBA|nr:hypothetical protein A7U60_g4261 [Sanghuangporus baumii]
MEETVRKVSEEKMEKKYKDSVLRLQETIRNVRLSNDKLSKQLFALTNRVVNIAERIGFASFDDLEEAVLDEPEVWKLETIKANHVQTKGTQKPLLSKEVGPCHISSGLQELKKELKQSNRQVHASQQLSVRNAFDISAVESAGSRPTTRSPLSPLKSVGNSSPSETTGLRAQLDSLSHKYDSLVAAKESAESTYKEDYRKWRQFKTWVFNKSKHANVLRAQLPEDFDLGAEFQNGIDNESHIRHAISRAKWYSSPLSNEENEYPSLSSSKQSGAFAKVTMHQSISSLRVVKSKRSLSGASAFRSQSASPTPRVRKRKSFHSDAPKPNLVEESLLDMGDSPNVSSVSGKTKGRYSDTKEAINALYAIDTSKNNGLAFQYDEVVRSKKHRQRLEAGDCDCCKEYYDRLEPLPSRLAPPVWLSTPKEVMDSGCENHLQDKAVSSHKKRISRHRYQWSPAKTPPDYWNIGFPTTQEAAEINRRAAEIHADKRRRVEKEANMVDGRYMRRQGH